MSKANLSARDSEATEQMIGPTSDTAHLLAPIAVRAMINQVLNASSQEFGFAVDITFDLNPNIPKRIIQGEAFDVGITNPWYVQDLIDAGKVDANSHAPFGSVPLAIAKRSIASRPTVTSQEQIRELLISATSIAYTADGTSGHTFLDLMRKIGVLDQISDNLIAMGPGRAALSPVRSVASGDAELAIAPLTTIIAAPDVNQVATFPGELDTDIKMSMFQSASGEKKHIGGALLRFLVNPKHDAVFAAMGMTRFAFV